MSRSDRTDTEELRAPVGRALEVCPVEVAIAVIGGARKMTVVKYLSQRTHRFGELRREVGPVTPRVLTRQLRELEQDGIVERRVYAEVPPRVEYSLTPLGKSLSHLVEELDAWGARYSALLEGRTGPNRLDSD
jgi:DNA-binding HxlR family transcriptional regulator